MLLGFFGAFSYIMMLEFQIRPDGEIGRPACRRAGRRELFLCIAARVPDSDPPNFLDNGHIFV